MPKVSIIVPVYKAEEYLCECLDSILSQTFSDFELILIDDGSTDGTEELIETFTENKFVLEYYKKKYDPY